MPRIKIECFCWQTNPDSEDTSWSATECGHIFHTHCLNEWIKEAATDVRATGCPECRSIIDGGQKQRRKDRTFVRLFFASDPASDGASQMPQGEDDPIEDSSDDEHVNPTTKLKLDTEKLHKRIMRLTRETRDLAFTKKDLVGKLEALRTEVDAVRKQLLRGTKKNAELVEANLDSEARTQHQILQIAELEETIKEYENNQPAVRLELATVRAELSSVAREMEWKVEDSAKRELVHQETEEVLKGERKQRVLERSKFAEEKAKLIERINREGSSGGRQIKKLSQDVFRLTEQLSTDKIQADEAYERLMEKMTAFEQAHAEQIARDASRLAANSRSVVDAELKQQQAAEEIARLQSGNIAWKAKYEKLNDKYKKRAAPVVDDSPESSPQRLEARVSRKTSPFAAPPAFKIKNTASLLNPSRPTEFDIELDDDEMESYRDRDEDDDDDGDLLDQYSPRKKQRTDGIMTTLIDRDVNTSFGVRTTSLSKDPADQHIPDIFHSNGRLDAGRKIKGKKGFSR